MIWAVLGMSGFRRSPGGVAGRASSRGPRGRGGRGLRGLGGGGHVTEDEAAALEGKDLEGTGSEFFGGADHRHPARVELGAEVVADAGGEGGCAAGGDGDDEVFVSECGGGGEVAFGGLGGVGAVDEEIEAVGVVNDGGIDGGVVGGGEDELGAVEVVGVVDAGDALEVCRDGVAKFGGDDSDVGRAGVEEASGLARGDGAAADDYDKSLRDIEHHGIGTAHGKLNPIEVGADNPRTRRGGGVRKARTALRLRVGLILLVA